MKKLILTTLFLTGIFDGYLDHLHLHIREIKELAL